MKLWNNDKIISCVTYKSRIQIVETTCTNMKYVGVSCIYIDPSISKYILCIKLPF